eukprot:INCI11665.1.p1 GENE.INCI11665.1~~INCI11665.1.p1  ORF type:complete len:268 (-),score=48.66 INCI11665.1:278-1081(-)
MSTMTTTVPRLGFAETLRDPDSLSLLDTSNLLSPIEAQFDFGQLDSNELEGFGAVTGSLLSGPLSDLGFESAPSPAPGFIDSDSAVPSPAGDSLSSLPGFDAATPNFLSMTPSAPARVAGGDATNRRSTASPAVKKPSKRKAPSSAPSTGAKGKAKGSAPTRKASAGAGSARKRSKMPEAEQKRRNCESAKRSRLKKMRELEVARKERDAFKQKMETVRKKSAEALDISYKLNLHLVTHHKGCQCCELAARLQEILHSLQSPRAAPN